MDTTSKSKAKLKKKTSNPINKHNYSVSNYNMKKGESRQKAVGHPNHLRSQMGSRLSNLFVSNKPKSKPKHQVSVQNNKNSSNGAKELENQRIRTYSKMKQHLNELSIEQEQKNPQGNSNAAPLFSESTP